MPSLPRRSNLNNVNQGMLAEAEEIYKRTLQEYEGTINTAQVVCKLYYDYVPKC